MRLPGSAEWKQEDVAAQIAFERELCRGSAAHCRRDGLRGTAYRRSKKCDTPCLRGCLCSRTCGRTRLCTEDVRLGASICAELSSLEKSRPNTPMQLAFFAAVASVAAADQIEIDSDGVSLIRLSEKGPPIRYRWPHCTTQS